MIAIKDLSQTERTKLLEIARRSRVPRRTAARKVIPPVERGELVPLSYAQQRLWFLSQTESGSRAYHMPFGVELRGRVNVEALCRALDRIVERHEALRTTFEQVEGEPRQRVREAEGFLLVQEDVRGCADPLLAVRERAEAEAGEGFDLERGPVIRGRLIRHGEEAYTLLVTMHHIASDGWSMGIFLRELGELYGVFCRGEADRLRVLPVQYADYALWQRSEAAAGELELQAQYWERALAGAPAVLELPLDRPRPAQQDYAGGAVRIELDAELSRGLKGLSQRAGTTLFMTVLGGWMAVLARLARQEDVVVGTPVANRAHAQIEGLIGFFVNALALRVEVSGNLKVRELLERVKGCALEAQQHQDIPFEQVVERVRPERSLAHSPIFQVVFTWQNSEGRMLHLPGLEVQASEAATHVVSKFDLTLSIREKGEGMAGVLEYATSLFDEATVRRIGEYLRTMLAGMVEDEGREIGAIELLTEEERRQVLEEWNDTSREVAKGTLAELFERQAEQTPEAVAIRQGEVALSYRELNERANRLAHYLRAQGVRTGQVVAVGLPRSVELVVALVGVLKAGAIYLPLDPEYPAERREFMLADAQPAGLLTRRELWEEGEAPEGVECWEWPQEEEEEDPRWAQMVCERVERNTGTGSEAAYIIYTSGSTGRPKGVVVPHQAIIRVALNNGFAEMEAEDRMAFASDPAFDAAMLEVWGPLLAGGCVVVVDQETLLSPERLGRLLEREGVNVLWLTVGLFNQYAETLSGVFAHMRYLITGGDVLDSRVIERVLGQGRPQHLLNGYGPTETAVFASTYEIEAAGEGGSVPIGRPIANTRIYILDERGEPAPVGVVGEIYIGGTGVAWGYLNRGELTAERFVVDRYAKGSGARMYRTGDLGRWRGDGTIEFCGRNDFQVKVRGYRIELGEIEARLREVSGVREAVVVACAEQSGEKRLVAYYTCEGYREEYAEEYGEKYAVEEVSAEGLRAELAGVLPEYMVPSAYVRLEQLPLTPSGKLDRRGLPAPDADAYAGARYEEPQGETEQALAAIWAELLKVERISRHDNFFNLGGHSLLAVRVVNAIRARFEGAITVRDVFAHPVLKDLAMAVRGAEGSRQTLIPPVERGELVPLSYAQQRLWFLSQTESGSRAYHMPFGVELRGRVNVEALRRALDRIVERHEALRTTFEQVEGEPRQRVREAEGFRLAQEDVRGSADPLLAVRERAEAEVGEGFDLERGPVIRGRLLRHGEEAYTLLVTMHHIASDGWSMGIFLRELGELYGVYCRGEADRLRVLPVQYADYALWQRSEAVAGELEKQAQYWERTLAGASAVLELPLDRPRPAQQDYAGGAVRIELDAELSDGLKGLSQRAGTTLFMTVLGGWMAVLARLARQEDVVVGTPVANRAHAQIEGLIGFFVNALALRVEVRGDLRVRELLERVKGCALEAQQHQDIPFEQVVERVRPERSLAHSPIFQTVFTWQNSEGRMLNLPGLEVQASEAAAHVVSKFDLTLFMREKGEGMAGVFEYATSLFDEATVRRIGEYLRTMLAGMVEDEECEIGAIELLSAEERRQVLEEWNDTSWEVARGTLAELFERQAERTPEAVAIRQGEMALSYRELNERANRLAHYLRAQGVRTGQVVAVGLPRSVELVVALVGVLKAGAIYLPLDPEYPTERREFMLADAQPAGLLTRRELWEEGEAPEGVECWEWPQEEEEERWWAQMVCERVERSRGTGSEAAYIIYTSGSTGRPKGVVVPHQAIIRVALNNGFAEMEAEDRMAFASDPAFDAAMLEVWGPLLAGGCVVVVDQETLLSPERLGRLLEREGVNVLWLTVGLFNQYAETLSGVFARMRYLITGGDVLDSRVIERVLRQGRPQHLLNGYGPTETAVFASTYEIEAAGEGGSVPIGRPIGNTRIYILDERGEPAPVGVVGEIYIGGTGVAWGYLNRGELTAERFVVDRYAKAGGARMYRTGDLGRWRGDGTIEFCGRNDFQVKVRGYRIELGEIEARLREVSGVREAVVVACAEQSGEKRLVAYYTCEGYREEYAEEYGEKYAVEEVSAEELRAELAGVLPEYMVPSAYVRLEQLPLTPSGKLDRRGLPAPDADAYVGARYEEPQGETEQALAAIWAELLKVERISRHDNFFNLGGHSLLAVRVVNAVRARFEGAITVRDVFAHPVLKDLAMAVRGAEGSRQTLIPPVERGELVPLSYAQQRLWFLSQTESGSRAYHMPFGVELRGRVNVEALRRALDRIVERHEALRTTFEQVEGEPRQRVREAEGFRLAQEDVRGSADPLLAVRERAEAEVGEGFDLERGPVIRGRLLRHGEEAYTLLVTMHHIASDGWSMGIFLRELGELYGVYCRGEADRLRALPVQYADYALWQRSEAVAGELEKQAQYWERTLAGASAVLELPLDRPRPAQQDYAGGAVRIELDAELSDGLKGLSQRAGTTLFMTVLGGWMAVLARLARQEDVVVGTPVANRAHAQIEGLIGFFVNALALRVEVKGNLKVRELLERVKGCALEAQQHQDIPFEQVVERVRPERSLAHSPIFQTVFTWQNSEDRMLNLPGLEVQASEAAAHVVSKFDLTLFMREKGEGIAGALEYATSLFDEATVRRIGEYLRTMLAGMVENEGREIGAIELLTEEERRQVLEEWNDTSWEVAKGTLAELFERQAERTPEAVAIRQGEVALSYRELNERANRLAHYLRAQGVRTGQVVAVGLPRSVELVLAFLGVLKAGAIYLPLDPEYPAERREFMLADAQPAGLLTRRELWEEGEAPEGVECWEWPQEEEEPQWAQLGCERVERNTGTGSEAAYIIYTSGSTGRPKGVVVPHQGIASLVETQREIFELSPDSRVLQCSSMSFDAMVMEILMSLCVGASLVIPTETKLVGDSLYEFLRKHEITHALLTPALLNTVTALPDSFTSLIAGGDAITEAMVERFGTARKMFNAYGPTESTICACISAPMRPGHPVTIGRPIANTWIYILDERGEPAPVGVVGEIYIGGTGVALGYLNREELTAERFVVDPYAKASGARMYRTGDLGRWRGDGTIEFCGRNDFQVKVRGYRIELGEIEARLREVSGVREAAVVARAEQSGEKRLVAYYTCEGYREEYGEKYAVEEVSAEGLRAELAAVLPEYMVPAAYVRLEQLPLTPSGKLDRRGLPAPDADAYAGARYEEPQGEIEQDLAAIWAELLKVERVGRHDNFFNLGGHSLLAVRLLSQIQAHFHSERSLQDVFRYPVLKDLACLLVTGNDQLIPDTQVLADLVLDSSIQQKDRSERAGDPEHVLLTGATGFLGAFLLRSLLRNTNATIHCLVRASSPADGLTRIGAAMSSYGIGQDFVNSRIVAIPGDLSAPSLGLEPAELRRLADLIDFVVHNGAWVNAAHTYNTLKQVNVDGTRELLRFASLGAPKPIHYVSTFNTVLTQTQYPDLANQTQCQEYFETLHTGYARSKWVAEMLLQTAQTRGLSTTIYRLPLIGAARCTGASNSNDLVSRFIDQCHQLGCIPEMKSDVNVIPVDDLADTFVAVALRGLRGIRYNIVNDTSLSMKRLIERMKTLSEGELKSVPGKEWLRHCAQSADGTVLATTLQNAGIASGAPDWAVSAQRCDTEAVLKVMHSPIDDEYLDRYLLGRMGNDEHQHLVATVNG